MAFLSKNNFFFIILVFSFILPYISNASWTDNVIFYAPFTNPDNPLDVSVGNGQFTYSRASTATYIHPVTGLLTISPSNLVTRSEDLSTTWIASSSQAVADQSISPDGSQTADELVVGPAADGNRNHYIQIAATGTPTGSTPVINQMYTASVYIKSNTQVWIALSLVGRTGTANLCYFNTTTGAIGSCTANTVGTSTLSTNGFYRYSVSANSGSNSNIVMSERIYLAEANSDLLWTGNNTNSIYVWGAQINSGSDITAYVKTTSDQASVARIESGGILIEGTRSNILPYSRNFSNASSTKTNTTATLTATGLDGNANSASVITATADNGTVCQSAVTTIATSSGSVDIKRITGSGSVSISIDGGSTYESDVSGLLPSSSWYRAVVENKKIASPVFCLKLGTNGDSVAIDAAQIEVSDRPASPTSAPFVSSRIITNGASQTRFIDKLSIPSSGNWPTTEGTFFVIGDVWDTALANKFIIDGFSGSSRVPLHIRSGQGNGSGGVLGRTTSYDGTSECSYGSVNVQPQTSTKMASRWSAISSTRATTASGATPTSCAFDGTLEVQSLMVLGDAYLQDGSRTTWGHMKQLRFYDTAFSDATIQLATSGNTSDIGTTPSSPLSLATSSIATSSVTLTWNTPSSDGGSSITDYYIQYSSGGASTTWSHTPSTATTSIITGLSSNTGYTFTVAAVNAIGTSSAAVAYATTSEIIIVPPEDPITSTSSSSIISTVSTHSSGTSVSTRYANLMAMGDIGSATNLRNQYPHLFTNSPMLEKNNRIKFTRNLQKGSVGDEVKKLQMFLNKNGYIISKSGPGSVGMETNLFGILTQKALAKFQKNNNIYPAVGYFGPKTREYLNSHY